MIYNNHYQTFEIHPCTRRTVAVTQCFRARNAPPVLIIHPPVDARSRRSEAVPEKYPTLSPPPIRSRLPHCPARGRRRPSIWPPALSHPRIPRCPPPSLVSVGWRPLLGAPRQTSGRPRATSHGTLRSRTAKDRKDQVSPTETSSVAQLEPCQRATSPVAPSTVA